jgi:putative redox protein
LQKAIARWSGSKVRFDVEAGSGHTAVVDEPPLFGEDAGMRPTEMLLGALASCTGINAVLLLKKYKQPYTSLAVEVEGDQQDEWPHAFTDIRLTFAIGWSAAYDEKLVADALDMACNRYCPVDATITNSARIGFSHRPEPAPAVNA